MGRGRVMALVAAVLQGVSKARTLPWPLDKVDDLLERGSWKHKVVIVFVVTGLFIWVANMLFG